jgi:hypothetical protein
VSNIKSIENKPEEFNPSETWHLDEMLESPILKAREEMNHKDPKKLIEDLQKEIRHSENGISYAILKGDQPDIYSGTEAIVMFNPFANAATPNMLVRTEFIREVAKIAEVRDEQGKLKPVVMLASPGIGGSSLMLTRDERHQVREGDLGPAAKELLHAVSTLEIGKVSLLGYSQGADMALAGARKAYSANLDSNALSIGDPAGIEDRGLRILAADFLSGPSLKPSIERAGLQAQQESVGRGRFEGPRFIASALTSPINNLDLILGMSRSSFEKQMQQIIRERIVDKAIVGYGSGSRIAKPSEIEPSLKRLNSEDEEGILTSVKLIEGNHTWGDQLTLLAKLYLRALK